MSKIESILKSISEAGNCSVTVKYAGEVTPDGAKYLQSNTGVRAFNCWYCRVFLLPKSVNIKGEKVEFSVKFTTNDLILDFDSDEDKFVKQVLKDYSILKFSGIRAKRVGTYSVDGGID